MGRDDGAVPEGVIVLDEYAGLRSQEVRAELEPVALAEDGEQLVSAPLGSREKVRGKIRGDAKQAGLRVRVESAGEAFRVVVVGRFE